jgi:subfamily B ATP-binding cassette protein MsbA
MSKFGRKMKKTSKATQLTMGSLTTLLQEAIVGVRIVKAFCMEGYEEARFRAENERFTGHHLKALKIRAMASPIMEVFGAVGFAATIYYASYRINAGTLDPANFVSFFAATIMLYQPIKALNGVQLNLQQGLAAAERVFDLLDMPPEEEVLGGDKELSSIDKGVEFRDVSFNYGEKTVLENVNFSSKKGEITAFVGLSGSGKSTLVNLIPRFYDVVGGSVLIDGIDIKEIKVSSLRNQIAMVSQEIVLFNDTVRNNIAYGDTVKSDEQVRRAAEAANAGDFIASMSDGYDTVIGEGGIRLSGGERQRLSIARAILKDAPILIMDEATSSLDTASEREVQKGLDNLMSGRTAFVIAHRLSTIRGADKIVVLRDGRVVETGTHAELLKDGGEYARLHAMQFYEDEAKLGA